QQEPMLIAVDRDLLRDTSSHDADDAAEVVERLPCDRAKQPVEGAPAQRLEATSAPRPAVRDDEIRIGRGRKKLRELVRVDLKIRRQRHQLRPVSLDESDHQRRRFSETAAGPDDFSLLAAWP